jgi:hypothetical protein
MSVKQNQAGLTAVLSREMSLSSHPVDINAAARTFILMRYKWIALSVTIVGTLMAGIDTRIIIGGLPTLARGGEGRPCKNSRRKKRR